MDRDLVIIVSGGRTGTRFLGDQLDELVENAFSVHEPDILYATGRQVFQRIAKFGLWNIVVGRLLGRTGIRLLSQKMLANAVTPAEAMEWVHKARDRYYESINLPLIIEANGQWYGALSALNGAYPNCRIVAIIRDPRDWVRSWINHGGQHDEQDRFTRFGAKRLSPMMIGDNAYAKRWAEMNTFEKLCWDWTITYGAIDAHIAGAENATIFRYEDLFLAPDRNLHIQRFFEFICNWPDRSYAFRLDDNLWSRTVHASRRHKLDQWQTWGTAEARRLNDICSTALVQKYQYCCEPEWREKLDQGCHAEN